jgi:lipopolysaccharide assembly outer membrane protein LptD (OstA)
LRRIAAALVAGIAVAPSLAARSAGTGASDPSQDAPLELSADHLEFERARNLYVASGSVVIRRGERRLRAEWVAFSPSTGRGVASGDVEVTDGRDTLRTRFVEFDIDDMLGVMFDARFDVPSGHLRMEGAEIAKTGDQTWSFEDATFTTCRCPDPGAEEPWKIRAGSADLEIGGYGTARDTTFEILGVPVAWLPWAIYPLKTERQSGLLLPDVELGGRNGFEVGLPVFFAAGEPVNVVATPRWLSKRGAKGDLEVEYVAGEHSGGNAFGSYIHDNEIQPHSLAEPFGRDRWSTKGQHDWFGPWGMRLKADYLFASDNAFPNDFRELDRWRTARYLPAAASVETRGGASGRFGMVAGAEYRNDRQAPDDTDRDDFVLRRLPQLDLRALPGALGPVDWLVPALDVAYARFDQRDRPQHLYSDARLVRSDGRFFDTGVDGIADSREQGRDGQATGPDPNFDDFSAAQPDGTEGDGVFQEGELLAEGGQRALFAPRIGSPWRVADAVEVYPEVGWRQTVYDGDAQGFAAQGQLTGRVEVRTLLRRSFAGGFTHLLEPRVGWAWIQGTHEEDRTPLFIPETRLPQRRIRELALDNVTLDPADRIESFNGLSFGFGNRLLGSPRANGAARLLAEWTLLGLYDFSDSRFGRVVLDGSAQPLDSFGARFWTGVDPARGRIDDGYLGLGWRHVEGHAAEIGYRYLREIPELFGAYPKQNERFDSFEELDHIHQAQLGLRIAFLERWAFTWAVAYSFEDSLLLGNTGGLEYFSACACWAARLELRQSRGSGVRVGLRLRLVGIGDAPDDPFAPGGPGPGYGSLDAF